MKKMKIKYCPICNCDISETYQEDEPGITGGWYCELCDIAVELEDVTED